MKRDFILEHDEKIRWEGRPAPRCYTFRHWRHSCFGLLFMSICAYWQFLGLDMAEEYALFWLAWLPVPFLLMGLYLTVGHLLQARLEWTHVCYVITDRRLIVQRGLLSRRIDSLKLQELTYFSLHRQGDQLGTVHVYKGEERLMLLHCIEYPHQATDLLEAAMGKDLARNEECSSQDVDCSEESGVDS